MPEAPHPQLLQLFHQDPLTVTFTDTVQTYKDRLSLIYWPNLAGAVKENVKNGESTQKQSNKIEATVQQATVHQPAVSIGEYQQNGVLPYM